MFFKPFLKIGAATLAAGLLFSCSSTPTKPPQPAKAPEVKIEPQTAIIKEDQLKSESMQTELVKSKKNLIEEKTTAICQTTPKNSTPVAVPTPIDIFDQVFAGKKDDGKETIKVALNFEDSGLGDVIPAFAQPLGFNYVLDSELKGTVTMAVEADMTRKEVWRLFEQILWMAGAYAVYENDTVHIRPNTKLAQERKLFEPGRTDIQVLFYELKYAGVKEIIRQLKPFLSDTGSAIDVPRNNAVLLVDNGAIIGKLTELLRVLDQPDKHNWPRLIFQCRNVPPSKLKAELSEILPVLGFPVTTSGEKQPENGAIYLISLDRMEVLVASAVTAEAIEELRRWAEILDQNDIGEQERVFIYKVINGKADELLQALSVIFNTEGTTMSAQQSDSGSNSASTAKSASTSGGSSSHTSKKSVSENTGKTVATAPASVFEVPVKIFADAVHNRLVIRTTPRTYAMAKALLERLDTVPAQVLLQVLVTEINLTDSTQFGLEFSKAVNTGGGTKTVFGTNYKNLDATADDQYGSKYYIYDPDDPSKTFAYIKGLAGKTKMKVISSPQILVMSHTKAKISVGDKVPLVTSQLSDTSSTTTSGTTLLQNIQYQDTGIILEVTPHVTKGNLITIDLEQTVSEAEENTTSKIDSPIIQERVLKTSMTLRNGRTLIIGGLIKEHVTDNMDSVPYFINVPVINWLTGNSTRTVERTEMLVLITANIIGEENQIETLVKRYRQAVKEIGHFQEELKTESDLEKIFDKHESDYRKEQQEQMERYTK